MVLVVSGSPNDGDDGGGSGDDNDGSNLDMLIGTDHEHQCL